MPGLVYQRTTSKIRLTDAKYTGVTPGRIKLKYRYGTNTGAYGLTSNSSASEYSPTFKVNGSKLYIAESMSSSVSSTQSTTRSMTYAPGNDWKSQTANGASYNSTYNYQNVSTGRTITAVTSYGYISSTSTQLLAGAGYWPNNQSSVALIAHTYSNTFSISSASSVINYTTKTSSTRTTYNVTFAYVEGGTYHSSGATNVQKSSVNLNSTTRTYTWNRVGVYGNPAARVTRTRRYSYSTSITGGGVYGYNYGYSNKYTYYESLTYTSATTISSNNCNV